MRSISGWTSALLVSLALAGSARLIAEDAVALPEGETVAHPYAYIGLRNNGSGLFPGAQPVTEWDDRAGKNVLWRTALPSWSASSPIAVDGKVITLAEPNRLLCFDAATGKLLWDREVDHAELLPPDDARKAQALCAEWNGKARGILHKHREFMQLESALGVLDGRPDDGVFKDNFAWKSDAALREEVKARVRAWPKEQVEKLRARFEELRQERESWGKSPTWFGKDFGAGAFRQEWTQAQKELARLGRQAETWYGYMGHTFATPVSDGARVYVTMGWGQIACYGLDGQRVWLKWHEPKSNPQLLYTNSPILVGDRLIAIAGGVVRALDKTDGKELWTQPYKTEAENHAGTPICVRLKGVDLILTSHGRIYRASDGKVVAEGLPEMVSMPAASGEFAYYNVGLVHGTENKLAAMRFRLSWAARDRVNAEKLWTTPMPGRAGMWVGPVLHQGLLHYSYPQVVWTLDAETGEVLAKHVPNEFGFTGSHAPNTVVAGGFVFAGDCLGRTLVIEAQRGGKVRGCNVFSSALHRDHALLDAAELKARYWDRDLYPAYGVMASTPFFAGNRTYIRTYEALYAIGQ